MKHLIVLLSALFLIATVGTSAQAASDMNDWKRSLITAVTKNQSYPRAAIAREIEGKAKVSLVVAADGTITAHEVIQPTGNDILDNEIPKLVAKLNPLPALPKGQDSLKFVLPLEWSLQ